MLVLGGGGGTSLVAQSSLPGDALYPIKTEFNEKIGGAVRFTAASKAEWDSRLAETRLDEVAQLVAQNRLNDETEEKIQLAFKAHTDSAEKRLIEINNSGKSAVAIAIAGEFEAGLKTRKEIFTTLKLDGVDKIKIDAAIESINKIRKDAEMKEKNDSNNTSEGPKNSAEGKIGAATNVIASVKKGIERIGSTSTTTQAEAQVKLAVAENLLAQAEQQFAAGEYSIAFDLAQQSIVSAHEARITGEIKNDLDLKDSDFRSNEENRGNGRIIEFEGGPKFEPGDNPTSTENRNGNGRTIQVEGGINVEL